MSLLTSDAAKIAETGHGFCGNSHTPKHQRQIPFGWNQPKSLLFDRVQPRS